MIYFEKVINYILGMPKLARCSEKADLKGQTIIVFGKKQSDYAILSKLTDQKKKKNKARATGRRSKNED